MCAVPAQMANMLLISFLKHAWAISAHGAHVRLGRELYVRTTAALIALKESRITAFDCQDGLQLIVARRKHASRIQVKTEL